MSKRVQYWNVDYTEYIDSAREYEEVGEILHYVETGDYYKQYERKLTVLYMDPETGLVVGDIAAYEKWVRS